MKKEKGKIAICELILKYGNDILNSPGMMQEKTFIQHGDINCFDHSISVAYTSAWIVEKLKISVQINSLIRGALLHDYFLYDWHLSGHKLHGFRHAQTALENAIRDFQLNTIERDIIKKHMFPLNLSIPRYLESIIVSLADKLCAMCEIFSFRPWELEIREVEEMKNYVHY